MNLSAQQWCQNVVMGWNLGNSFESEGGETGWGNPKTTRQMIQAVKKAGFNAIRIPVRWTEQLSNSSTMTVNDAWLARVKEVVDWALAEDMYVIINTHHEAWLDRNPFYSKQTENNRKLAALWKCIATYFRNYDERLAFAGTNETTVNWANPTTEHQAVQNSYNQTFVDAVRATGGKNYYRHLVVQTYACSPYHGLNGFTIPNDPVEGRLSVEYHYYDPYGYGLLTENPSQNYYYWGKAYKDKGKVPADNEDTQAGLFDRIQNAWGKKGLGVVMGEYGVTNHYQEADKLTQQENMQYYLKTTVSNARKRGFAAFVWDNNGFGNGNEQFGIFKRWQNMAVGNEFFLKGICEGAGTEYKEPEHHEGIDNIEGGDVIWEGDAMMDWGNGLQFNIPGSEIAKYGKDIVIYLVYTLDYTDYNMIQFFFGDWKTNPSFFVDGKEITKEYIPSDIHGVSNGDVCISTITLSQDVYNEAVNKGFVIQGHGVRLNQVVLANKTGIEEIKDETLKMKDSPVYNLNGQLVESSKLNVQSAKLPKGIYISNGKKYVAK
ncbi:MAG: glycoside hydrolase family 5 protein [Prevotella sp.]|nr:glycoside hydrolase family 5 protein [Prevotella sp.]